MFITKVAYTGKFPSVDMFGQPLTGARASKAGSKLHGGPYALVVIRQVLLKKINSLIYFADTCFLP